MHWTWDQTLSTPNEVIAVLMEELQQAQETTD